ncbi:MAG: hypothetical protein JWN00_3319 [Actinomycetia bacterium]|nr:hypothetical protein [Actinomycetes bacterium]
MNIPINFTLASKEFYEPLESATDGGQAFAPSRVPEGWQRKGSGAWTMWFPADAPPLPEDGWKVHVSARPDRLAEVLDTTAAICFELAVPFKHLSSQRFYFWTHHKYASRQQSGKFVAAYPADADEARTLMERLRTALADEEGPYVLTDRRFRDSRTVHYRYGAYTPRFDLQADGTRVPVVRDGNGRVVPDRREAFFHLPEGVFDPFAAPASAPAPGARQIRGFIVTSAVRYTNAGGTYRGQEAASGRRVFIKEARSHTAVRDDYATATEQLREEWEVLTALHELAPGLAPEPIAYFREWEHEFMVTEHVDGLLLHRSVVRNHPAIRTGTTTAEFEAYYARCERILSSIQAALDRLHAAGYLFVDISPGNVLVGDDDAARLVDFGSAHRLGEKFLRSGTPGFAPPEHLVGDDLSIYDDYGMSSLALSLLAPVNLIVDRGPGVLAHLRHDLSESAPIPPGLWNRAIRYRDGAEPPHPSPEEAAGDPVRHLTELRDRVADAVVAMADAGHPQRVFPTIAQGWETNTLCVAYGTAGVVHALRRAGRQLPEGVLERLRSDALADPDALPPGLLVGSAGIAQVLTDCGLVGEALDMLSAADRHRLTPTSATLYGGSAGVAMAHLSLYGHTGDERHIDHALALAAALPRDDADLTALIGANDATGLLHGRCGIALMLQQLAGVTGEDRHLRRAVRLLHAELDRASDPDAPGLLFPVSATDRRAMPYLFAGSAGMVFAVSRCLRYVEDERLAAALPRMLAPLRLGYTVMSGLFQGLAGYAFTLADHGLLADDEPSRQAALRATRYLLKYAIPHGDGVRFLGDQLLRYSAELWSGSAGVLLALSHVLAPRPDALFTVDELIDPTIAGRIPDADVLMGAGATAVAR